MFGVYVGYYMDNLMLSNIFVTMTWIIYWISNIYGYFGVFAKGFIMSLIDSLIDNPSRLDQVNIPRVLSLINECLGFTEIIKKHDNLG